MIARVPSYRMASGQYGRQRAIELIDGWGDWVAAFATGGISVAVGATAAAIQGVPVPGGIVEIVEFLYKATGIDKQIALFTAIWNGENVGQAFLEAAKSGLHMAALVAGFFPGIGTVVGAVLSFADALVSGESITDALLNGIAGAIPGGLLAKEAWIAGRAAAEGILAGDDLDEIGLRVLKAEVTENARIVGGDRAAELAAAAFDLALALARGKKIQDVVKSVVMQAATHLAGAVVSELQEVGQKLGGQVLDSFTDRLPLDALDKAVAASEKAIEQAKSALPLETLALCKRIIDEKTGGILPDRITVDGLALHLKVDLGAARLASAVLYQIAHLAGVDDLGNYAARARRSPWKTRVTMVAFQLTASRKDLIGSRGVASPLTLQATELGTRTAKVAQAYTGYTGPALNVSAAWHALRSDTRSVSIYATSEELLGLAAAAPVALVPPKPLGFLDRLRARAGGHTPPLFIATGVMLAGTGVALLAAKAKGPR